MREVRAAAGSYAPEALKTLLNIMRNRRVSHSTRIAAASAILDRAVGRPAVPPPTAFDDGTPVPALHDPGALDTARRIAFILQRALDGRPFISGQAAALEHQGQAAADEGTE